MTNIIIQPEVIEALADCVVDIIQNKIDWQTIDWQSVAEKAAERPKGKWEYTTHHARRYRICPFCKCEKEDDRSADWFYCYHCGARLEK